MFRKKMILFLVSSFFKTFFVSLIDIWKGYIRKDFCKRKKGRLFVFKEDRNECCDLKKILSNIYILILFCFLFQPDTADITRLCMFLFINCYFRKAFLSSLLRFGSNIKLLETKRNIDLFH